MKLTTTQLKRLITEAINDALKTSIEKFTKDDIDIISPDEYTERYGIEVDDTIFANNPRLKPVAMYAWKKGRDPFEDFNIRNAAEGCKLSNGNYYLFTNDTIDNGGEKVADEATLIRRMLDIVNTANSVNKLRRLTK